MSFPKSDTGLKFSHQKLMRFNIDGQPVAGMIAININEMKIVEKVGLKDRNPNWEGLCWYKENEKLPLVFDQFPENADQVAVNIDIPIEWKLMCQIYSNGQVLNDRCVISSSNSSKF